MEGELRSLPRLNGDNGRLQQVVTNLLSDAVKFTPSGGTVRIAVKRCIARAREAGCRIIHTTRTLKFTLRRDFPRTDSTRGVGKSMARRLLVPWEKRFERTLMEKAIGKEAGWRVYGGGASAPRRSRLVLVDESAATRKQRGEELLRRLQPNGWDEV